MASKAGSHFKSTYQVIKIRLSSFSTIYGKKTAHHYSPPYMAVTFTDFFMPFCTSSHCMLSFMHRDTLQMDILFFVLLMHKQRETSKTLIIYSIVKLFYRMSIECRYNITA